jgi:uncharacterized protein with PQ loop repeat
MLIAEQIARLWRDGFIEFVDFGFNPGTIGFIGAITLAILGGVGQYHQLMKIRKGETGKGVSTLWTLSFAAMFSGIMLYSIEKRSLGLLFTCLVRVSLYAPILWSLWKYNHGFSRLERFLGIAYFGALIITAMQSHRFEMFIVFNWVGIATTLTQPLKWFREKAVGVFSVRMLVMYTLSVVFWLVYNSYFHVEGLTAMMWCLMGAYTTTYVVWRIYRDRPALAMASHRSIIDS